uniref:Replication protein A OB domain-containing protein n=1 Tax=Amphimedon queenslandica TaxID=400682 RepID=A0A1X7TF81_AMPQE
MKSEIDGALQLNSDEYSVKFEKCSVKSKIGTGYEIVMTQRSTVACSPKKFHVDNDFMKQKVDIHSVHESSLKDTVVGNKVRVNVKILSLKEVEEVTSSRSGKTLKKQDAVVADHSQACRLVLWEDIPNSVQLSKSYQVTGATVKFYNGQKYL